MALETLGGGGYDYISKTPPTDPDLGEIWLDHSVDPAQVKVYVEYGGISNWDTTDSISRILSNLDEKVSTRAAPSDILDDPNNKLVADRLDIRLSDLNSGEPPSVISSIQDYTVSPEENWRLPASEEVSVGSLAVYGIYENDGIGSIIQGIFNVANGGEAFGTGDWTVEKGFEVRGNLNTSGAVIAQSDAMINGTAVFDSTVDIAGQLETGSDSDATFNSTTTIEGDTNLNNIALFDSNVNITGSLSTNTSSNLTFNSTTTIGGDAILNGTTSVSASGSITIQSNAGISNTAIFDSNVDITGSLSTETSSNSTFNSTTTIGGDMTTDGDISVNATITSSGEKLTGDGKLSGSGTITHTDF